MTLSCFSLKLKHNLCLNNEKVTGGARVAQLVKCLTLAFGSGNDLTFCGFKPHIRLCADSQEPAQDSRSPSPCPSPSFILSLSLSLSKGIKKHEKKERKNIRKKERKKDKERKEKRKEGRRKEGRKEGRKITISEYPTGKK